MDEINEIEEEEGEEVFDVDDEEEVIDDEEEESAVPGADCVWDGTGDDVDELSMNQLCSLYTESECISSQNGKSKGRCLWKGKLHSKTSKFHQMGSVEDENHRRNAEVLMVDHLSISKVLSMQFSTFDVVLGTAFFATLCFAAYQVYQWCAIKAKSMGIGHDYTPLHDMDI